MSSTEQVAGLDVSGTEFEVRFGEKSWLTVSRGWYIYGSDGEKRGRILTETPSRVFSRSGTSMTSRVQDPNGQTVLELRQVEGGVVRGQEAARYDLVTVEGDRKLGTFQQADPLSAHWTYRIPTLNEYAVVTVPTVRWGASTTVDRPHGPSICHVDFSLTGMVRTLSMEVLHPRLKALILATGVKLGGARS